MDFVWRFDGGDNCGGVTLPSRYSVSRTNGRLQEEHQERSHRGSTGMRRATVVPVYVLLAIAVVGPPWVMHVHISLCGAGECGQHQKGTDCHVGETRLEEKREPR